MMSVSKEEIIERYAQSARAIALWLEDYCHDSLPYDEMIAEAARRAWVDIERLRNENTELRRVLDRLARLGNEPNYGNSLGNQIAQRALGI